jgi:hypothetical protein
MGGQNKFSIWDEVLKRAVQTGCMGAGVVGAG